MAASERAPASTAAAAQGQDGDQWVAAFGAGSWVGYEGQVGEQVRGLGLLERASIAQRGQPRRG
jgi:hypothetical protein